MGCNPENMRKKLIKVVHYFSDGTMRVLEGKDIEAYQNNIARAAALLISHFPSSIEKENWKERKSIIPTDTKKR